MSEVTLVFGIHAVRSVLLKWPARIERMLLQADRTDERLTAVMQLAQQGGVRVQRMGLRELDAKAHGERHQGIIAEVKPSSVLGEGALDELLEGVDAPLLLVLDGVQDPHNLGACLRTANAAGVLAVIVPRDRAVGLTPVVRKVASGAAELTPLIQVVNLARTLRWLKERSVWIVGTDEEGDTELHQARLTGSIALVMGAEGHGLRRLTREHCDVLIRIPMVGGVESLNVSVATGVTLFEALRQRQS